VYAGGGFGDLSLGVNGGYYDTRGYRDNGGLRKKSAGMDIAWSVSDTVDVSLAVAGHEERIGLPGPVSPEDFEDEKKRRETAAENDFSHTVDFRYKGAVTVDLEEFGQLDLKAGFRDRDNHYIIGYNPLLSDQAQTDKIVEDSWQLNLTYTGGFSIGERNQELTFGLDFFQADYMREDAGNLKRHGDTETLSWFASGIFELPAGLTLSGGCRRAAFTGHFRDDTYVDYFTPPVLPPPVFIPPRYLYSAWERGLTEKREWDNEAFDAGLAWEVVDNLTLFASSATSYRIPNVDEFALADDDLHPQKGRHWDAGVRWQRPGVLEIALSLFRIKIEDEIYYGKDPATNTSVNRNYDENAIRKGLEADLKFYPHDSLYIWGNYSYTRARFEEKGTCVPLVPKHKGAIGVEWYPLEGITLAVTANMVGPRFDGNDPDNDRFERLHAYELFDCKVSWEPGKGFKVFAGVNNLLDTYYATAAYSESYYPMPTRSWFAGVAWTY
jgi:iron complex outermembrane receptor protein